MKNVTYISAGAGSGKTYTLTTKLAELVAKDREDPEHVEPEQVILTTFTVKAANEFREKAKAELYRRGRYDEASRLDHALIGTIDSVASTLIQKYWYAVGLSPKQGVMDEAAKTMYINQSIANIPTDKDLQLFAKFRKAFNITDSDSKPDYNFWKDHLKDIVEKSISFDITDYAQSISDSLGILKELCTGVSIHLTPSQRNDALNALQAEVERCRTSKTKDTTLDSIAALSRRSPYIEDIEWCAEFNKIVNNAPKIPKGTVPDPFLEEFKQKARSLWHSTEVYTLQKEYIETIFRLAREWNVQYGEYKRNRRIVDFCDIEHYMHKLLQDSEVAEEIGRTYTHLFVDEFQDCSPIQVKIFEELSKVVRQSYWVGDTKQAIYGFRASDTALTKAVADIIAAGCGKDGLSYETLGESWRSVPTLVDVCNNAFAKIFQPVYGKDTERQVSLRSAMLLHPEKFATKLENRPKNPLRYLNITEKRSPKSHKLSVDYVALYIRQVMESEGVALCDIAVLGRTGYDLDDVQAALAKLSIPCDRETALDKESRACQLMMALVALTVDPHNDLAKAEIAYMTQDGMGIGAIIDSKLEHNSVPPEQRRPWLAQTEMIRRVDALRPSVKYQGIGALMETLAVELDVKNVMERWPGQIEDYMTDVKTLIATARQYEERSSGLAQPATPSGFAAFLNESDVRQPVKGNGVQLLTYHAAKGLEWRYVFMLMDEKKDQDDILRRELYGIHHFHSTAPSANNLYPQMSIRLLPWIFGTAKKVPDTIKDVLLLSPHYTMLEPHLKGESARLLYVGMTRAAEVLVLVPWFADDGMWWFEHSGLSTAGNTDGGDVLGIGVPFQIVETEDKNSGESAAKQEPKTYRHLAYHAATPSQAGPATVAPSLLKDKADCVRVAHSSHQRIRIDSGKLQGRDYSEVGDCIHNVYAAIENMNREEVTRLIQAHGMGEVLPQTDDIIRAWDTLQSFLHKEFGEPTAVYHERPFRSLQPDGSTIIGSMDYVYLTKAGTVLIDFKTFPREEEVTDPSSTHYAGLYAGQLNAYTAALTATGDTVLKRYIYYPVTGTLVEVE